MFEDEILDEQILKDLISDIPGLRLSEAEESDEIGVEEETLIIKTFHNNHQAYAYRSVMIRAGIPAIIEVDRTLGNMDPLFNTGTALLRVREVDTPQAIQIIEVLDKLFDQDKMEKERASASAGTGSILFNTVLIFGAFLLILLLITGPESC